MNKESGFRFCRGPTDTLRSVKPRLIQNAEYWPFEFGDFRRLVPQIVAKPGQGGAGFDVVQHDGLRSSVRGAVQQASFVQNAAVDFDSMAVNLYPQGYPHGWPAVPCVENHDIVKSGPDKRVPAPADASHARSCYARNR